MKRTTILLLMATLFLYSCDNKGETEVLEKTKEFFVWYVNEGTSIIKKSDAIIVTQNNGYSVNLDNLNAYISALEGTHYFSEDFVQKERESWSTTCVEQIKEHHAEGLGTDGIPPCVLEADPFFYSQDVGPESLTLMEYAVDSYSDEKAVITYDSGRKLNWVKENGEWKINKWP